MASAGARAYNWGLGAEPPAGSRGQSPRWGSGFLQVQSLDRCVAFWFYVA